MVERQYAQEQPEQQFWTEGPFEPEGLLAEIPALLNQGIIPVNYRPQTDEDRAAIYILHTAHQANTPEECTALTLRTSLQHRLVLPRRLFWCYMAAATYPTLAAEDARYRNADQASVKNDPVLEMARKLAEAWEANLKVGRSVNNSSLIDVTPSDVPREVAVLAGRLESLCGSLGISDQWSLYSTLAINQITFIHRMWWQCGTEEARHDTASIGAQNRWYFANLMLAIACVARAHLEELYKPQPNKVSVSITPGLSPAALNFLFGRTDKPAGYIPPGPEISHDCLRSKRRCAISKTIGQSSRQRN